MITILGLAERNTAIILRTAAYALNQTAAVLESSPVSGLCQSVLSRAWGWTGAEPAGAWLLPFSITVSIMFVFGAPLLFRFFYDDIPHLDVVPAPAAKFDPAADPQSETFADDDVRPQLVGPDVVPSVKATEPSTGELLGYIAAHTVDDVDKLVRKASSAQKSWALSSFERRRRVLRVLSDYILYEQLSLCDIISRDSGKPMHEACFSDLGLSLEKCRWLIRDGEQVLRPSRRSAGSSVPHKLAQVEYSPIGVIAAIVPWNFPVQNVLNPVTAALFAGCGIVVKPSEYTVWSAIHIIRVVRRALAVCGENPDLVQCLVGEGDVAAKLVKADGVDKVFFTGSTATGRKVAMAAAERLRPTCLELGGKDVCIVADDADVANAVDVCVRGVFFNSGQICVALERVYVHRKVKDEFVRRVVDIVKKIRVGIDMGSMTMGSRSITHLENLVQDAVNQGAQLVIGGKQAHVEGRGCFFEPTVLVGVTEEMKIATEETFGPVLCIYEWDDDDVMLETVNRCEFGLGSSVCSEDKDRAGKLSRGLKVGMCNVNDFCSAMVCQSMPFGGTKNSGYGKYGGIEGLRECCLVKSISQDRFFKALKTPFPKALRYPVAPNATEFTCEINDLLYRSGIISKVDNIRQLIGMSLFPSWKPRCVGSG